MLRPLSSRLIIKPEPAETQSQGGIIFPETHGKPPAMTGEVVGMGRGPASAQRVREATIARCVRIVNEQAEQTCPKALQDAIVDALARYAAEVPDDSEVREGDYVCFAYTAGHNMQLDGEAFIVIDEADVQAVWQPEKESAA